MTRITHGVLTAAAIVLLACAFVIADRSNPTSAAECGPNSDYYWVGCVTPPGPLKTELQRQDACLALYTLGASEPKATELTEEGKSAAFKSVGFKRFGTDPITWTFDTRTVVYEAGTRLVDLTKIDAAISRAEKIIEMLELPEAQERLQHVDVAELLDAFESEKLLLEQAKLGDVIGPLIFPDVRMPYWVTSGNPAPGFAQPYLTDRHDPDVYPDPTLFSYDHSVGYMSGNPPGWDPTIGVGVETLECEGWAHVAYVARTRVGTPTCDKGINIHAGTSVTHSEPAKAGCVPRRNGTGRRRSAPEAIGSAADAT